MARQRSSAGPLAATFVLLLVYASLHPFAGWRWPPGLAWYQMPLLPWLQSWSRFDDWGNFLGYVPLGLLLFAAAARSGLRTHSALAAALLLPALLSFTLELTQQFLPARVPSMRDWTLNTSGALAGAVFAVAMQRSGYFDRWQRLGERWFVLHSSTAIALLLLWPVALLFPAPVPLALGQLFGELRALLQSAAEGTAWELQVADWLLADPARAQPLASLQEGLATALGLLAPCLLAICVVRPGWRRWAMLCGALAVATATTTLTTVLYFGPHHALTWMTPATLPALGLGVVAAGLLALASPRQAAAIGLVVLTALVSIAAAAPEDPYYAASLQRWEQGRFIRFHGVAQWVAWLWPYAAMAWMFSRLTQRDQA